MYNFGIKDYLLLIIKSVIIAIFLSPIVFFLIKFNIVFSKYICYITKIPENLNLTVMSFGFRNEVFVLLSVLEFVILFFLFSKIIKNKYIKSFLNFLIQI